MAMNFAPFEKAVAGSTPILFAQDFPGRLFKPAHPCEKDFYENINDHPKLKELVAEYYGTLTYKPSTQQSPLVTPSSNHIHPNRNNININLNNNNETAQSEYLVLEDLTYGFLHPCILDVKLGISHHDIDPNAPAPPQQRQSKYITTPLLGFCLTGMQSYKKTLNKYEFMSKVEGWTLTEESVADKLRSFFDNGFAFRNEVLSGLIDKLKQVEEYFSSDPGFTFRSTSLLLIYEGDIGKTTKRDVDVRMIDFAHAKRIPHSSTYSDHYGYLFGTRNLVRILSKIKDDFDNTQQKAE